MAYMARLLHLSIFLQAALIDASYHESLVTLDGLKKSIECLSKGTRRRGKKKTQGIIPQSLTDHLLSLSENIVTIEDVLGEREEKIERRNILLELTMRDLVKEARKGKLDPIIGRDCELERLILCLGRRKKHNAIITGSAGVGKTGLVEALAQRIADDLVPEHLRGVPIYSTSIFQIAAQRPEKVGMVLEAIKTTRAIIFMDEIHLIMEGRYVELAQILKPILIGSESRFVGATTREEFTKHLSGDEAFRRRFERIDIDEPTPEECFSILSGVKNIYETHHHLTIDPGILRSMVSFSTRYLPGNNPDKSIDLLEASCVRATNRILGRKILVKDNFVEYLRHRKISSHTRPLELSHVKDALSAMAKVSGFDMTKDDLSSGLKKHIAGLDNQLVEILNTITVTDRAVRDIGCSATMCFLGPSGSGKEYTARSLCKVLFGGEGAFLPIDVSYFSSHYTISQLLGSPAGYVGYEIGGGILAKFIRDHPSGIIYLHNIGTDPSHILNVMKDGIERGFIKDASGLTIDLRNYVIIGSLNTTATRDIGFAGGVAENAKSPEFLHPNICFSKPTREHIKDVTHKQVYLARERLKKIGIDTEFDPMVLSYISEEAQSLSDVDRMIRNAIDMIESSRSRVRFKMDEGKVCIE